MDLLATNQLAHAFYSDVLADTRRPANLARFTFLDERARHFYTDWDVVADITVAILRTEAGPATLGCTRRPPPRNGH